MNFFHIWLITVAVSIFMHIKNKIEMYHDIADAGYLLNSGKLDMINEEFYNEVDNTTKLLIECEMLIPIYNLIIAAIREDSYYRHTKEVIDELKEYGVLEAMSTEEKEEYSKNPTGFNAIKIVKKKWLKLSKAHVVVFEKSGSIWFDYKDDFEDNIDDFINNIIILHSEGEVSTLSIEEQIKLVYNSHISMAEIILNNYEKPDEFIANNVKDSCLELEITREDTSKKQEDHPNHSRAESSQTTENKPIKRVRKR